MRRILALLVLAVAVLGISACSDDGTSDDAESEEQPAVSDDRIVGVWVTSRGGFHVLHADGSFGTGGSAEEARDDPYSWGRYTFDGSVLTYFPDGGSENCVTIDPESGELTGMVGTYEVSFSQDGEEQFRTVIEDPCHRRTVVMTPSLIKASDS